MSYWYKFFFVKPKDIPYWLENPPVFKNMLQNAL